jgi:hypothetical protein
MRGTVESNEVQDREKTKFIIKEERRQVKTIEMKRRYETYSELDRRGR